MIDLLAVMLGLGNKTTIDMRFLFVLGLYLSHQCCFSSISSHGYCCYMNINGAAVVKGPVLFRR